MVLQLFEKMAHLYEKFETPALEYDIMMFDLLDNKTIDVQDN